MIRLSAWKCKSHGTDRCLEGVLFPGGFGGLFEFRRVPINGGRPRDRLAGRVAGYIRRPSRVSGVIPL
ncbi:hypothetical protein DPEC_G00203690 [Dallia pectoralis]|uniref:Uncharacterized protein n=1 Tax=Dallia pectoralis TaxID=75939 RepID=A0ACC2G985_DALPE|nr:hypothetical protein DPEC_G00203690 [Dallia pectoralis]